GRSGCAPAAHAVQHRHDLLTRTQDRAQPQRTIALERRQVVMRVRGFRRSLVGTALDAELCREAVQFVGVIREQMTPPQSLPPPQRVVDIDGHGGGNSGYCRLSATKRNSPSALATSRSAV